MLSRALALAALLAASVSVATAGDGYLPVDEALAALADGRPWTARRPDGEIVRLTLRPDGTGRFEGPVTRAVTWSVRQAEICIVIGFPMGSRCLRLVRRAEGFDAHEAGRLAFALSR